MAAMGRSVLPILLALLAAGCLAPAPAPAGRADIDGPAALPQEDPPGSAYDGRPLRPPSDEECGEMTLEAEPRAIRPGEDAWLRAAFRNCGEEPLERTTPCVGPVWEPRTLSNGSAYYAGDGAAHEGRVCLTAIGHWRVEPGEAMEGAWRWNGTLTTCRATCVTEDAAPGVYGFSAVLSRTDAMTQQGEGAWTASVRIEVLPRA